MTTRRMPPQSGAAPAWRQQYRAFKAQAGAWWTERTPRERVLLRAGAALAGLFLIWTQGLRPALETIADSRETLPRLRAEAARVNALILETQALQRTQSGHLDSTGLSDALNASLRRAGLDAAATLAEIQPPDSGSAQQWRITLDNAAAAPTMDWLAGLPRLLHLQTLRVDLVRANVDGRDRPGHLSGHIVVHRPAGSPS